MSSPSARESPTRMLDLCAPSKRGAIPQHLIPCRRLLLNLGVSIILENSMSFNIVTAMMFTAFAALLARDSDSVHGARRETLNTQSGITGARWRLEWCPTQQRTEVGRWP